MAFTRPVHLGFWTNEGVRKNLSSMDKLVFLYLLTNTRVDQIGIYRLPICFIAYEMCLDEKEVRDSLNVLEQQKMIIYCEETDEVAILNYNKYSLLSGGIVVQKCFNDINKKVKNKSLLVPVYENLLKIDNTYEEIDEERKKIKASLEYAKSKIRECLEHNGLLKNVTFINVQESNTQMLTKDTSDYDDTNPNMESEKSQNKDTYDKQIEELLKGVK